MRTARELDLHEVYLAENKHFIDTYLTDLQETKAMVIVDMLNDTVYALGGIIQENKRTIIWLLCTTAVEKNKIKFLRFCKDKIQTVLQFHKELTNTVWEGNDLHIKWLVWLGAEFISRNGAFLEFIIRRKERNNV